STAATTDDGAGAAPGDAPQQLWRIKIDRLGSDAAELAASSADGERVRKSLGARAHAADAIDDLRGVRADFAPGRSLAVVSHRVVDGGPALAQPLAIAPDVLETLRGLAPLAALHQPHNVAGIEAARDAFPDALQVACFDTAFHRA